MDQAIFKSGNIEVTPTFVHVSGVSYPLANITSIRVVEDNQARLWGIAVVMLGVVIFTATPTAAGIGAGLVAIAFGVALYVYGLEWHLIITTGAAERQAMTSRDKDMVTKAGAAINVAISQREQRR